MLFILYYVPDYTCILDTAAVYSATLLNPTLIYCSLLFSAPRLNYDKLTRRQRKTKTKKNGLNPKP